MTVDMLCNKLLYVPFNEDYKVEAEIKNKLTEKEFFGKCFQKPEFDENIEKALKLSGVEVNDFEIDLEKIDIIEKLERQKEEASALESWIVSKQADIYCIKGDAGTGKTTYLHYLKYKYSSQDIFWSIVDIQDAVDGVRFLGHQVDIPQFNTLYAKTISAMLLNMSNSCFTKEGSEKINYCNAGSKLETILAEYKSIREGRPPRSEVDDFYSGIIKPNDAISAEIFCEQNACYFQNYFTKLLNQNSNTNIVDKFAIVLEIFIYFLNCLNARKRVIIALDNFERFIGTDEIFNCQLTEFVDRLRSTQRTIANNNAYLFDKYQVIVAMRNTTLRMFVSQQATEFFEHFADLTDWFDASSVLTKKIKWYQENEISLSTERYLLSILEDMGECGGTLRGLHFKISMLFNYNKRVIIQFLAKILVSDINKYYVEKYNEFWENKAQMPSSVSKFAARSIIYRLVLNALRTDGFFANIIVQRDEAQGTETAFTGSGFARKILTILHDHSLNDKKNEYVALTTIIDKLFPNIQSASISFFDDNNELNYMKVCKVLYYMNYYDGRNLNWLQFIDIQYNDITKTNVSAASPEELAEIIKNDRSNVKIKITNAGKAYLFFVVYYFEYFSCKSLGFKVHASHFGKVDMPPLLCSIPTIEEISEGIEELACIKILKVVSSEALMCISNMMSDDNNEDILFKYKRESKSLKHSERIINSHRGYIDNFVNCIEHLYGKDGQVPEKVKVLIQRIVSFRELYRIN